MVVELASIVRGKIERSEGEWGSSFKSQEFDWRCLDFKKQLMCLSSLQVVGLSGGRSKGPGGLRD